MSLGLNDEALGELQEDASYLTEPQDKSTPTDGALVIVTQDADEKYADAAVAALDNFDVTLQTTEEGVTRVHKLDEISNTILAAETIDQSDAEQIAQNLEGFEGNVGQTSEFTQVPTKTLLKPTQQYVQRVAVEEKDDLVGTFLTNVAQHTDSIQKLMEAVGTIHTGLVDDLDRLRVAAIVDQAKAGTSRAFLTYKDGRLTDLRSLNITRELANNKYDTLVDFLPPKHVVVELHCCLNDSRFQSLHCEIEEGRGPILLGFERSGTDRREFSYLALLGLLASNRFSNYFEEAVVGITKLYTDLKADIDKVQAEEMSISNKFELIERLAPDLRSYVKKMSVLYGYQSVTKSLVGNVEILMNCYRKQLGK
jgi:hypothetical protein